MAVDAGTAFVDIQPKIGAGFFGKINAVMAGNKLKSVGLAAGAVLGVGLTAGIAGVVGAFKVGESFDKAFDTIRIGTGAVGEDLAALEGDFKEVFKSVPTTMDDAATAVADLNTRTGLTGEPLQELSKQILEMTRLTGGDLSGNVKNVTRLFGDWGVEAGSQAETMDKLWRVSQSTGIGIEELATLTTNFGAPLRQLGFGMDESLAIFGKWNKEGVNTEAIMGGLKAGLGRLAKSTDDVPAAFAEIQESILGAGSATEATKIAVEHFGTRAGPDLAAAIREGRFEIGDMMGVIEDGTETIADAASDTESFGEKWKKFANKLLVAVEPIATKVFDAIGKAMDALEPHIPAIIEGFESFFSLVGGWIRTGARWWNEYKDEILAFAAAVWDGIGRVKEIVMTVFDFIRERLTSSSGEAAAFGGRWAEIFGKVRAVLEKVWETVQIVLDLLKQGWEKYGEQILGVIQTLWESIQGVISGALDIILGIFDVFMGILTGDWQKAWDGIQAIFDGFVEILTSTFTYLWDQAKLVFKLGWDAIQLIWDRLWESIKSGAKAAIGVVLGWVTGWWGDLKQKFTDQVALVTGIWTGLWDGLKGKAREGWNTFIGWVAAAWDTFKGWWDGAWEGAKTAVSNVFGGIVGVVKGVFNSMIGAIARGINLAIDVINQAIKGANIINPFKDISYVSHVSIPQLAEGGTIVRPGLTLVGEGGEPELLDLPTGASVIPLDRLEGGRPYNVTMVLDGRVLASASGPHLVDDLVLHSGERRG